MTETQRTTPATRLARAPNFDIRFPPLPRSVTEVTKLISEKGSSQETARLIEIVDSDPVMTGSVLRRINSAFYGVRKRVGDVQKAANMLGFEEVCDIVLTSGMLRLQDIVNPGEQTRIFDQIMRMSVGTAAFARRIGNHLSIQHQSSAFTLGLLHTCGRLVLLYNRPDDYEALWSSNGHGFAPNVASEQIIFGTDHAVLGSMAVESWKLPDMIAQTIRHYLTPGHLDDSDLRTLALTLSASTFACEKLCLNPTWTDSDLEPTAAMYLLAKTCRRDVTEILDVIDSGSREVFDFMHSMVSGS